MKQKHSARRRKGASTLKKNHKSLLRQVLNQARFFHQENILTTLPEYLLLIF